MRKRLSRSRLAIAILAAGVLAGCGGSPTSGNVGDKAPAKAEAVYNELSALSGDQRLAELKKRAEQEGQLVIYTSMTSDVADAVVDAFEDTYDVKVSLYRAGSETVLQRILQEQKANFAGNDVVETNATEMLALNKEGLMSEYKGEARDRVAEAGKQQGWTGTRFNIFSPSWNTKLVKNGEQPKNWEELADPKWDGKLSMEVGDYDWFLTLYDYFVKQGKSPEEAEKIFRDMAQGAKIVKGHTVQGELLSAGQFSVAASNYTYLVDKVAKKGAPVAFSPLVQPVVVRPNGVGLMKTATHPAAAMLFTEWLLTDGQDVLLEEGITPSVAGKDKRFDSVQQIPVDTNKLLNESDKWSKLYEQIVSAGEQVKG